MDVTREELESQYLRVPIERRLDVGDGDPDVSETSGV
jgi:hypothetical protein